MSGRGAAGPSASRRPGWWRGRSRRRRAADRRRRRCAFARSNRRRRRRSAPPPRSRVAGRRARPTRRACLQLEAHHPAVGAELDQLMRAAGVEQRRRGCRRDAPPRRDCRSAARTARRSGMLATSSPVTPSIISSRSISSAFFFAAAPTPSASSTDSALGATCRPTPTSPNSRACSSTSERKPCRASASAQASPPMPPPAIATGLFVACWRRSRASRTIPPWRGRASSCRRSASSIRAAPRPWSA